MRQCLLGSVYGGKTGQINDVMDLMQALKDEENLTKEIMGLLQDEKVAALLRDKDKIGKIMDFYNRLDPKFRNKLPGYIEFFQRVGRF